MSRPQLGPAFPSMCPLSLVDQMAFSHGAQGAHESRSGSLMSSPQNVTGSRLWHSIGQTKSQGELDSRGREIDLTPVGGELLCAGRRELLAAISVDTHTTTSIYHPMLSSCQSFKGNAFNIIFCAFS